MQEPNRGILKELRAGVQLSSFHSGQGSGTAAKMCLQPPARCAGWGVGGGKLRATEISDLLGRFPKTSGFLGTVRKEGVMAVREEGKPVGKRMAGPGIPASGCRMPLPTYLCGLGQGTELV